MTGLPRIRVLETPQLIIVSQAQQHFRPSKQNTVVPTCTTCFKVTQILYFAPREHSYFYQDSQNKQRIKDQNYWIFGLRPSYDILERRKQRHGNCICFRLQVRGKTTTQLGVLKVVTSTHSLMLALSNTTFRKLNGFPKLCVL
jgi:hypothetical protein